MWSVDCSEVFSVSVVLLVPAMTFTRDVVVLVHPVTVGRACLHFRECVCSFSSSLTLLLYCMELFHSPRDMLEYGLRIPLHI